VNPFVGNDAGNSKTTNKTKPHYEHNENKNTAEWRRQCLG